MTFRGRSPVRVGAAALLLAAAASGCPEPTGENDRTARWSGSVDTAADGTVVVENAGGGAWEQDTVRARRTLLLGETGISGGEEATTFGDIVGLAVDADGRIYVGDGISNTVRAYGPDGRHLGLVGGEGRGPGEFRVPDGLTFGPGGRLYVAELDGITVMADASGDGLRSRQIGSWRTVTYPQIYRPFRVACDGTVYYPHDESDPQRHLYLRFARNGALRDTVAVPPLAGLPDSVPFYVSGRGGRMLRRIDHPPLSAIPSWDVTPAGNLVVGEARRYRMLEVAPDGDTLRVVRRRDGRRPIPGRVRRESTEAVGRRIDTLPVPPNEVFGLPDSVAMAELPRHYPAHGLLRSSTGGRIWVERPPLPDRQSVTAWDVFDREGLYLGTVLVPGRFDPGRGYTLARRRPRPLFTDDAVYGVVKDSVTGVQRVARFSYHLPEREDGAPSPPKPGCPADARSASR